MALTAAVANLNDPDQLADGRRLNSEAKAFVSRELEAMGYQQVPSQANFIMIDVKSGGAADQGDERTPCASRAIIPCNA